MESPVVASLRRRKSVKLSSDEEQELVMVIRLAAVEGDQFSSNSGEVHKLETERGGVVHHLYDTNPGPTDLSSAANIQ